MNFEGDIEFLRSKGIFDEGFLEYLRNFKFTGDIYAVKEGTPVLDSKKLVNLIAPAAAWLLALPVPTRNSADSYFKTESLYLIQHSVASMFLFGVKITVATNLLPISTVLALNCKPVSAAETVVAKIDVAKIIIATNSESVFLKFIYFSSLIKIYTADNMQRNVGKITQTYNTVRICVGAYEVITF